jgi:hypothetical protein
MKGDMNVAEFSRALSGLIFYEHSRNKESLSHLKKVKLNVDGIIEKRKGE